MASLIAAAGFMTYEKSSPLSGPSCPHFILKPTNNQTRVRSHRAKKKAKKEQHNASRYSELQNDKTNGIGEKRSASASSSREDLSEGERERREKVGRGKREEAPPPAYESLGMGGRVGRDLRGRGDEVVR